MLHVIEPLRHFKNAALQHLHTRFERQRTRELLQAVETELVGQGVNFGGCIEIEGAVSDAVITAASQLAAELIVLGAGNLSANRAVGLKAQSVMEHAEQPVLVIHPDSPRTAFRTILCPVDHSSVSRRGLRNAVRLAKLLKSQLIVLSVIPDVSWLTAAAEIGEITDAKADHED